MESTKNQVFKKKLLILLGVLAAALIVLFIIGMVVYNKASSYVISKTIIEFGQVYDNLSPEEKKSIDDFINSIELPANDLPSSQIGSGIAQESPAVAGSKAVAEGSGSTSTTQSKNPDSITTTEQSKQESSLVLTASDGSKRSVSDIEKLVTKEDKDAIISIILSKMTLNEAINAFMSFGGKMSGEKFEAFKKDMKSKFTEEEIYAMKEMYIKYMTAE